LAKKNLLSEGEAKEWLYGVHTVTAVLCNNARVIHRLLILSPEDHPELVKTAAMRKIAVEKSSITTFNQLFKAGSVHQGVAVCAAPLPVPDLETVAAKSRLMVVLDQVSDPHNVGAIVRSAAAFSAGAVVGQDRHGAAQTALLAKTASGGLEHTPYIQVNNIARALDVLKKQEYWVVGLDGMGTESIASAVKAPKVALVLGAEGKGLRRLVAEHCHTLARIPTLPHFASLNVSNAAAVGLYAVCMKDAVDF
jgi:23S rRNA (guanosine2251-2'-O)-methyltransferase